MNNSVKPTILMVDDDFDVLFTTSASLAAHGFEVAKFNDPESAVEAIRVLDFDVVVSDIKMPRITGLDLLDAVKRHKPDTPLIFMTGFADLELAIQAIKRGAFDFLTKPVDLELLIIALGKALKVRNARLFEVSYQERLEDDLLTRTAELRSSLEHLEMTRSMLAAAEEAKDIFLSTISHELRTPMNGIVGPLSLLSDTARDQEQRELIEIASQSANNMCALVDRIIKFTALKSGRKRAHFVQFSPGERITPAIDAYREITSRHGIDLLVVIDPSVPEFLKGDLESYLLVLDSLLSNAVKFTEQGEIRIDVSVQHAHDDQLLLKTVVHDTGAGIPEEKHETVLQEFSQGDGSYTRAYGGLGIGLNTSLLVVQTAGGHLWFESSPGAGSDFHFTFPFKTTTCC